MKSRFSITIQLDRKHIEILRREAHQRGYSINSLVIYWIELFFQAPENARKE